MTIVSMYICAHKESNCSQYCRDNHTMSNMHTYGTLIADKDSTNNVITDALGGNCTDEDIADPKRSVLITLGIGAALAGSLVTIAIILAAVGIVCCYRQIKKRKLL